LHHKLKADGLGACPSIYSDDLPAQSAARKSNDDEAKRERVERFDWLKAKVWAL
jgi:hypothetical protein